VIITDMLVSPCTSTQSVTLGLLLETRALNVSVGGNMTSMQWAAQAPGTTYCLEWQPWFQHRNHTHCTLIVPEEEDPAKMGNTWWAPTFRVCADRVFEAQSVIFTYSESHRIGQKWNAVACICNLCWVPMSCPGQVTRWQIMSLTYYDDLNIPAPRKVAVHSCCWQVNEA
jgi:hypothetical protein